jgi:hypothetical protein
VQAIAAGISMLIFALCIGVLTVLKEPPAFWTNAGGYPVGLRHFVLEFYYLLLLAYLGILLGLTLRGVGLLFRNDCAAALLFFAALMPAWLVTFLSIGLLVANNAVNLIEGRPLHYHAP